eukprot:7121445-Pyramimonas_sp.AAC.1
MNARTISRVLSIDQSNARSTNPRGGLGGGPGGRPGLDAKSRRQARLRTRLKVKNTRGIFR